jgi:hypothetical protein
VKEPIIGQDGEIQRTLASAKIVPIFEMYNKTNKNVIRGVLGLSIDDTLLVKAFNILLILQKFLVSSRK